MANPYLDHQARSKPRAIEDQLADLYRERERLCREEFMAECGDDFAHSNGTLTPLRSARQDVDRRIRQLEAEQGEGA